MAKEDFCFTYYDGDAARDKAHMSRLERGAYDDIISAQRKRGHLSTDDIKKVLGKDFDSCWSALEWVLAKDEKDKFFISWVDKSVEKSKINAAKNKEKIDKYWERRKSEEAKKEQKTGKIDTTVIPQYNNSINLEEPLIDGNGYEDGNGNENEDKGGVGEKETFLVPQMLKVWKKAKPKYPSDQQKDFPALNEIAEFISNQENFPYNPRDAMQSEKIISSWEPLSQHISNHNFFNTYSLSQVSKHIQSIVQDFQNGNSKQSASNVSTQSAFDKIDKLTAKNGG